MGDPLTARPLRGRREVWVLEADLCSAVPGLACRKGSGRWAGAGPKGHNDGRGRAWRVGFSTRTGGLGGPLLSHPRPSAGPRLLQPCPPVSPPALSQLLQGPFLQARCIHARQAPPGTRPWFPAQDTGGPAGAPARQQPIRGADPEAVGWLSPSRAGWRSGTKSADRAAPETRSSAPLQSSAPRRPGRQRLGTGRVSPEASPRTWPCL